ncbi:MAG: hypothetical protein KF869_04845 [Phycisphaeraceae bacterium]|nr:hypothetical protein [Phycisphaeraceae bacterium]
MPISEKQLRVVAPEVIVTDRPCANCGYSLRGLQVGGVCPECGHAISRRARGPRYSQQLVNAPLPWLDTLAAGATMMFLAALGFFVLVVIMLFVRPPALLVITGLVSLGWLGGVWICTGPRPAAPGSTYDTRREWVSLRLAARLSQACWPMVFIAALGALAASRAGTSPVITNTAIIGAALFALGAVAGLAPLCALLAHTTDWAEDSSLAQGFRACAWTICFCGFVIALTILNGFTGILGGIIGAVLAAIIITLIYIPPVYFLWCLFRFQRMARWAVWNHVAAEARLDRFRARAEANAAMPRPEPDRPRVPPARPR